MGFNFETFKNMNTSKQNTVEEVIDLLEMMQSGTELNIKNKELFEVSDDSSTYLQGKYEGLSIALVLVKSIYK